MVERGSRGSDKDSGTEVLFLCRVGEDMSAREDAIGLSERELSRNSRVVMDGFV